MEISTEWQQKIDAEQEHRKERIGAEVFDRIRYGAESPDVRMKPRCHDCGVLQGQVHVHGCAVEICGKCKVDQVIGCSCSGED